VATRHYCRESKLTITATIGSRTSSGKLSDHLPEQNNVSIAAGRSPTPTAAMAYPYKLCIGKSRLVAIMFCVASWRLLPTSWDRDPSPGSELIDFFRLTIHLIRLGAGLGSCACLGSAMSTGSGSNLACQRAIGCSGRFERVDGQVRRLLERRRVLSRGRLAKVHRGVVEEMV
jgi:hypothetical protein